MRAWKRKCGKAARKLESHSPQGKGAQQPGCGSSAPHAPHTRANESPSLASGAARRRRHRSGRGRGTALPQGRRPKRAEREGRAAEQIEAERGAAGRLSAPPGRSAARRPQVSARPQLHPVGGARGGERRAGPWRRALLRGSVSVSISIGIVPGTRRRLHGAVSAGIWIPARRHRPVPRSPPLPARGE